ncbi:response regulator [Roseovarius sp. S4756]|uniref:response regulator n=1 Tax=Roseovarius maritimus TaxID=3342637 RepID=UPI00372B4490
MLAGYILLGAFVGSLASIAAVVVGAPLWLAFAVYALVGATSVILLALARMWLSAVASHEKAPSDAMNDSRSGGWLTTDTLPKQQNTGIRELTNILVVDDDPFILEIVPKITAEAGFRKVSAAASGEEALRLLANPNMIFDCLLLDVNMPGMDGIELCSRVRQIPQYRDTPVVMLTAKRDIQRMSDAYRAGATDYSTKPFVISELSTRLRLIEKSSHLQRASSRVEEEGPGHDLSRVRSSGLKASEVQRLEAVKGLIDQVAFYNYLTQLPRLQATDIQVFAVSIDCIELKRTQSLSKDFVPLLQSVALTTADCLGVDQTLMAYTEDGTLLIALNSSSLLPPVIIEKNIEKSLNRSISDRSKLLGLSVGGPIRLQDNKANRARSAIDHAVGLAKKRVEDKHGVAAPRLVKK